MPELYDNVLPLVGIGFPCSSKVALTPEALEISEVDGNPNVALEVPLSKTWSNGVKVIPSIMIKMTKATANPNPLAVE